MLVLLLCACLGADPQAAETDEIPKNFQEYFDRADKAKADAEGELTRRISDLEIAIGSEPQASKKMELKLNLRQAEKDLDATKRNKPIAFLATDPKVGDIGSLPNGTIKQIVDDRTATIFCKGGVCVIAIGTDTKRLKAEQATSVSDTWKVVARETKDEKLLRLTRLPPFGTFPVVVVEPVKPAEVESLRNKYQASKKARS